MFLTLGILVASNSAPKIVQLQMTIAPNKTEYLALPSQQ